MAPHAANAISEQQTRRCGVRQAQKIHVVATGKHVHRNPTDNQAPIDGQTSEEGIQTGLLDEGDEFVGVLQQVKELCTGNASNGCGRSHATHEFFRSDVSLYGFGFGQLGTLDFPIPPGRQAKRTEDAPQHVALCAEQMGLRKA